MLWLRESIMLVFFIWLAGGYLCGSIPSGLLIGRLLKLGDVRGIGSGNIGATNVLRTGNKTAAALTLLCDLLKAAVPVALCRTFCPPAAPAVAFAVLIGHIYPAWLRFKGGKGVASALGAYLALCPATFGIISATWLSVFAWTRISSLSALISLCGMAPFMCVLVFWRGPAIAAFSLASALLILWTHRTNIQRLRTGEEAPFRNK